MSPGLTWTKPVTVVPERGMPSPYSLSDLLGAFGEACGEAWDTPGSNGIGQEPSVTLPDGLWPELEYLVNPVTRSMTPVQRVPMFDWVKE